MNHYDGQSLGCRTGWGYSDEAMVLMEQNKDLSKDQSALSSTGKS